MPSHVLVLRCRRQVDAPWPERCGEKETRMASIPSMRLKEGDPSPTKNPLFLRQGTGHVGLRRPASTAIVHEMYCYLRWAKGVTAMRVDEILVNVMDRALADYFSRDRSWRSSRTRVLAEHPRSDWGELFAPAEEGAVQAK